MSSSTFSVLYAPSPSSTTTCPSHREGAQEVLDVGFEGQGVRGSLYGHRLAHTSLEGDRGDQGGVLAAVARDLAVGPLSPQGPRPQARHGGRESPKLTERLGSDSARS